MGTCIKIRVHTSCCGAGSGEKGVMEDVKRDKFVHKVDGHKHKNKCTYFLLFEDSCEEGVMEDIKRDKCAHKVD